MSNSSLYNFFRFFLLLAAQILIFNNIELFGFLNPFAYILFIILYPVNGGKNALLLSSFAIGLIMDFFCNSGGVHAFASLVLAYNRASIFKFCFGLSYEYQTVKLNDVLTPERFLFITLAVLLHHTTLFVMEIFNIFLLWEIIYRTILTSIFTIVINIIIIYLIKPTRR